MDPITQGLLGAALPQSVAKKQHFVVAGSLGLLAGMAPDLDVLIRSSHDPLLFLYYHRQFTHSLFFIPFGSFICALVLHPLLGKKYQLSFKQSWLYCALGFATHGLLDACTSYGTQLLWPLSDTRYAGNVLPVIDPLFTVPILLLIAIGVWRRRVWLARIALLWAVLYSTLGLYQKERVEAVGWQIAKERQHQPLRLFAKPSFANILLWKVVYETDDSFYVDAVRAGQSIKRYPGESTPKLNLTMDFPWLDSRSQQAQDIERFRLFSNGYLAQDPNDKRKIIDVRYSIVPNRLQALWGIQLSPSASENAHVEYTTHRDNSPQTRAVFIDMLQGL